MQFKLGEATVTVINAGNMQADWNERLKSVKSEWRSRYPDLFATPRHFPCQNVLVQRPDTTILIDAATYAPEAYPDFVIAGYTPPPPLWEQLEALDVEPQAIEHIILTHSHYDHYSGLTRRVNGRLHPTFPNATVYLNQLDRQRLTVQLALRKLDSQESETLGFIEKAGKLRLVEGEQSILPGVRVIPTPGETAGHQMVVVESAGATLLGIGDLIQHPAELHEAGWHGWWVDKKSAPQSIARLKEEALATSGLLVAAHIDGVGRIAQQEDEAGGETAVWQPITPPKLTINH